MGEAQTNAKSSKGKYIGVGVGVAVVAIAAIVVLGAGMKTSGSNPNNFASSGPAYTPTVHTQNLVNGIIGVKAGGYQAYPFTVPNGATNAHIVGSFTASGGSGNDIIVLVLDQTSFTNWQNGHQVNTYYNSGQLTTQNVDQQMPVGQPLYLVYDNVFSSFTEKSVTTKIDLEYTS